MYIYIYIYIYIHIYVRTSVTLYKGMQSSWYRIRVLSRAPARDMADSKDGLIVEGISVKADKTGKESRGSAQVKES